MLAGPHAARAAHTTLDFVNDQQDSVAMGELAKFRKEFRRRHNIAAFALNRFNHHRRNLFGRDRSFEESLDCLDAGAIAIAGGVAIRTTIRVGIGNMAHTGKQWTEPIPLHSLAGSEGKRPVGAPMEASEKGDKAVPASVETGELHRRLDAFRAGVGKMDALGKITRRNGRDFLRKLK